LLALHIERANQCLDPSGTQIQVAGSFGSEGNVATRLAFTCMGATNDTENLRNDTENLRKARIIVSERLRAYFAEIKAELDADSEEFFKRVMQQAHHRQHAGMR
jgi:uncharacterized protein YegL